MILHYLVHLLFRPLYGIVLLEYQSFRDQVLCVPSYELSQLEKVETTYMVLTVFLFPDDYLNSVEYNAVFLQLYPA